MADNLFQDGEPVFVPRQRPKVGPDAQVAAVLRQDIGCEGVKRAQVGPVGACPEQLIDSLPHFGGSLVREGQGKCRRILILLEQPRHTQRKHARLAGSGAGKHQQRTTVPFHGPTLVLVEIREGDHCWEVLDAAEIPDSDFGDGHGVLGDVG